MPSRLSTLFSTDQIASRVDELAAAISADYAGKELILVGVLKGCLFFLSDLARRLEVSAAIDLVRVASYGEATETTGVVRLIKDIELAISGKHVLLVEDIVDTGLTLDFLRGHLTSHGPASFATCVLLDKPSRRKVEIAPEYIGFSIEDRFVVGYGLDYNEQYRQLPAVYVLEPIADG